MSRRRVQSWRWPAAQCPPGPGGEGQGLRPDPRLRALWFCIRVYNRVGSVDLNAPSCVQCGSCGGRWAGPALEQLWSGLRAGREPRPQTLMSAPLLMPRHHQAPSAVCGEGLQSAAWLGRAPSLVWGLGRHPRPLAVSSCSESCSLRGRRNQGSPLGTPRARPAPHRAQ